MRIQFIELLSILESSIGNKKYSTINATKQCVDRAKTAKSRDLEYRKESCDFEWFHLTLQTQFVPQKAFERFLFNFERLRVRKFHIL